jgi:hypothetical protein
VLEASKFLQQRRSNASKEGAKVTNRKKLIKSKEADTSAVVLPAAKDGSTLV